MHLAALTNHAQWHVPMFAASAGPGAHLSFGGGRLLFGPKLETWISRVLGRPPCKSV